MVKSQQFGSRARSHTSVVKTTPGKKSITVNVKKMASANSTGYQIRYATTKSALSKASVKSISKSYSKTSATFKSLAPKKTYYYQVRTYKKTASGTLYTGWSTAKSVKTL